MSVFGRLWTPPGSREEGDNRSFVGTGLGWYLDSDYLRTAGSTLMGVTKTSSGGGGGGEPLSPNTQYTDTDTGTINVANTGDLRLNISFSNVNSRVYWMWLWLDGGSMWPGQSVWCIAAISDQSFSIQMDGWGTQNAAKPTSYYYTYLSLLPGMSEWNDVYGIAMGWHLSYPQSASYNYDPNYDWSAVAQDFHDSVTVSSVQEITKIQSGAGAFAFTKFPVSGVDTYVGLGVSSVAGNAEIAVEGTSTSYTTRTLDSTTFTMYYTDQLAGEMTAYVPVIEVASMPSISNLSDYQTALFNAIVSASGLSVITELNS